MSTSGGTKSKSPTPPSSCYSSCYSFSGKPLKNLNSIYQFLFLSLCVSVQYSIALQIILNAGKTEYEVGIFNYKVSPSSLLETTLGNKNCQLFIINTLLWIVVCSDKPLPLRNCMICMIFSDKHLCFTINTM